MADKTNILKLLAPKNLRHLSLLMRPEDDLKPKDVRAARAHIHAWWHRAERYHPERTDSLINLPQPYIIPSFDVTRGFNYEEQYYWDSYFIAQGLLDGEHNSLVSGMLENLLTLFERYKIIPNASRSYLTGHSQPPLLTSYIFDVYESMHPGGAWLERTMALAKEEYKTVWMGTKKPHNRKVYQGLSRYYDINLLHDLAEAESGWDMTPRFKRHALDYLPVDLNALLYKYETDFAKAARILGKSREAAKWDDAARVRADTMNELMWDHHHGLYYDYDYIHRRRSDIASLAAFFPMWAGMVDEQQASALVANLGRFEKRGGLVTTQHPPLWLLPGSTMPMQWAYPNGWAPLHFIVVKALERYGYHADARRIAMKWLRCNLWWFNTDGEFIEKYNVVQPHKPPHPGLYPTQTGFAWTNAIFERLCRDYVDGQSTP